MLDLDHERLKTRIDAFRGDVARRLSGEITEADFKPLRMRVGLHLQRNAYMLRVVVPSATLTGAQLRQLAMIADRWDRGYAHVTTRQNVQFNWPDLRDVPDMLEALISAGLHGIQETGNCIRNVTTDHFAGAAAEEVEDPRITADILRSWSTDHPEFAFLPRKFKVAVTASEHDRAVIRFQDLGLRVLRREGEIGYEVVLGGGLGRAPMMGKVVRDFVPRRDLLAYLEAVLRTYNLSGRRNEKYKARMKMLIHDSGLADLIEQIEVHFAATQRLLPDLTDADWRRISARYAPPDFDTRAMEDQPMTPGFRSFLDTNTCAHKRGDHAIVTVSLKPVGGVPGDISAGQMRALGDIAERFAYDELRLSHEQNAILPHVHRNNLRAVYDGLSAAGLATANVGLISDIIACPGMDYCAVATARSIPVAQSIAQAFEDLQAQHEIGSLKIKISGCVNACGHHHVGHIGILGLERNGAEYYQITLGGDGTEQATLGTRTGHGFSYDEIVPAVERIIGAYLELRASREESFLHAFRRIGPDPFRAALYEADTRSGPVSVAEMSAG